MSPTTFQRFPFVAAGAFLVLLLGVPPGAEGQGGGDAVSGRLTVPVAGLRSGRGTVRCAAYATAAGWPSDLGRAAATAVARIRGDRATAVFSGVPAGPLGVACYHDENGNQTMDRNLFGAPTEGWGVTRGARGNAFSGPPFTAAVVRWDGRSPLPVRIGY